MKKAFGFANTTAQAPLCIRVIMPMHAIVLSLEQRGFPSSNICTPLELAHLVAEKKTIVEADEDRVVPRGSRQAKVETFTEGFARKLIGRGQDHRATM